MQIAMAVRERADCRGQRVGAVVVRGNRIVSTGYNGVPEGMRNCNEGGCYRCRNRESYKSGEAYDLCICVHAEQNAVLSAARFGISIEDATVYTTTRPCFGCTKELLQANVKQVFFIHDWEHPDEEVRDEYLRIQEKMRGGIRRLDVFDPKADWAKGGAVPDETGHPIPGPT